MKKSYLLLFIAIIAITLSSCKKESSLENTNSKNTKIDIEHFKKLKDKAGTMHNAYVIQAFNDLPEELVQKGVTKDLVLKTTDLMCQYYIKDGYSKEEAEKAFDLVKENMESIIKNSGYKKPFSDLQEKVFNDLQAITDKTIDAYPFEKLEDEDFRNELLKDINTLSDKMFDTYMYSDKYTFNEKEEIAIAIGIGQASCDCWLGKCWSKFKSWWKKNKDVIIKVAKVALSDVTGGIAGGSFWPITGPLSSVITACE
ncbi:MAG: hypothetical protein ACEPOW_09820 [Bacteroidales bacterium]